jgi:hypothetical protein
VANHATLSLHDSEEVVEVDFSALLQPVPNASPPNPITDYFLVTDTLKAKIIAAGLQNDSELLGLLTLGVVSSVEFYVRNILCGVASICPVASRTSEMSTVAFGSRSYFEHSPYSWLLSHFDSESLADAEKIKSACKRFTGLKLTDDSSVCKVLDDFEKLCELRHCFVHCRGFVGLKASHALSLEKRELQKALMTASQAFELLKLAHNVVRATNRFLLNSIANRWVDQGVITGTWATDGELFRALIDLFELRVNATRRVSAYNAYRPFQSAARKRAAAMALGGVAA